MQVAVFFLNFKSSTCLGFKKLENSENYKHEKIVSIILLSRYNCCYYFIACRVGIFYAQNTVFKNIKMYSYYNTAS